MAVHLDKTEQSLLEDVREYIRAKSTPELVKECITSEYIYGGPVSREFYREFAANGWLVPAWPKQYGGRVAGSPFKTMRKDDTGSIIHTSPIVAKGQREGYENSL